MVRLLLKPSFEHFHRFVDVTKGAVRQRQQSPSLGMLRPERDDFTEADERLLHTSLGVQQDTEVRERV